MSAAVSRPPRHGSKMTMKWTEPIVAWFWHIWQLLCSLAVLTKRRPPLPRSASHPELESGLFTFGASTFPRVTPSRKAKGDEKHPSVSHDDSAHPLNIMDFQFNFEAKSNDTPGDLSQGSLPSDSSPGTRANRRSLRRQKGTRESSERRRQRRAARIPDFVPPPEIHIEDWSDNASTPTSLLLPSWQLPEFRRLSSLGADPVPFVIITPSTPSVESGGVLEDLQMIVPLAPTDKLSPLYIPDLQQTALQCDQIAQVLPPDGSDESTPSLENDHGQQADNADFTFTDSLKAAAFGKPVVELERVAPGNLPEHNPVIEIIAPPASSPTTPPPPTVESIDESFRPISNSTPRHTSSQPEAVQGFTFEDGLDLNLELSFHEQASPKPSGNIPYCDIFDLDMYADLRASMAAFGIYANDHHGADVPPLPAPSNIIPPDRSLPVLARFSFTAPLNLPISGVSEDTMSTAPEAPQAASESGPDHSGRSSGIYTLSGHFKFPPIQPPKVPPPAIPDSPEIPLAIIRQSLTQASNPGSPATATEMAPSTPPPATPRILFSGGSHLSIGSEIRRYKDHYRHSAYSRSPPLRTQPTFAPFSPGSFGSIESIATPRRSMFTPPIISSPLLETVAANRSLPETRGARGPPVKTTRRKRFSTPDPEVAEGIHASPRRTPIFRVPSPREPLGEVTDLVNGQNALASPTPQKGDVAKGQRKSSPSISSLVSAKGSKRKNQAPWKGTKKNSENTASDAPGTSKSSRSAGVVRRLTNARKGVGGAKATESGGVAGVNKEEPAGGRTLNLLKEVNRQQERRKAGVVEEADDTMTSGGHVGETTFSSLTREVLGLMTPRMNHDRILKHRGDSPGERIASKRRGLFAKL